METGLSVDDRPNELNIAFWVISSVGATRPLLLHIIYVSVHATSLSFSLSFTPHTPLHTHPHVSISLHYALVSSIHIFFLSPGILRISSFIFLISSLSLSLSATNPLSSLSLPPFALFPPSLSSSHFLFRLTFPEPFFALATFPSKSLVLFPPSLTLPLIRATPCGNL